jgi:hypothetical protein
VGKALLKQPVAKIFARLQQRGPIVAGDLGSHRGHHGGWAVRTVVGTAVLLHNGGFSNDCITKQCMHLTVENTRNASYNDLVSQMSHDK